MKDQIVRTAERLLAERGLDGVSLRQIGVQSGNGNNSAVQYHFGSKEQLLRAIFEHRLSSLHERRMVLIAERKPDNLRCWLECFALPILEQGELEGSYYLTFVAMLQHHGRREVFVHIPAEFRTASDLLQEHLIELLPHVPPPLRTHRLAQAVRSCVHTASDRERARADGRPMLPFAVEATDLMDGLVGFLEAPVSPATVAALQEAGRADVEWALV